MLFFTPDDEYRYRNLLKILNGNIKQSNTAKINIQEEQEDIKLTLMYRGSLMESIDFIKNKANIVSLKEYKSAKRELEILCTKLIQKNNSLHYLQQFLSQKNKDIKQINGEIDKLIARNQRGKLLFFKRKR